MNKLYIEFTTEPIDPTVSGPNYEMYIDKYIDNRLKDMPEEAQWKESYLKESVKNPHFSSITSISLGYVSENEVRVQTIAGEEQEVLSKFYEFTSGAFSGYDLVVWDSQFSLPFFSTRAMANGISIIGRHRGLEHLGLKSWNLKKVTSLGPYLEGSGYFRGSLNEWSQTSKLKFPTTPAEKVYNMAHMYTKATTGQVPVYELVEVTKPQQDTRTIWEKINDCKTVTEQDVAAVLKITKKKKLTKKDKDYLIDIILAACYDRPSPDMPKPDPTEVEKKELITKLINELT